MGVIDGTRHPHLSGQAMIEGKIANVTFVHKFGSALDIGTTLTPVCSSKTYPTPAAAVSLELVSTDNTNDIPAGAGARTVRVYGIQDWDVGEVEQDVALNGTTAVPLTGTWLRVYRMKVLDSGTYATSTAPSHNSTITLRVAGAGATWAAINSSGGFGFGQSEIAAYSVPSGYTAYLAGYEIWVSSGKTADLIFFVRENADDVTTPYTAMQSKILIRSLVGTFGTGHDDHPIGGFTGPCDMGWMAASTSTTSSVSIAFDILLVKG